MPIEHISDWEKRLERQDAFWHCEIIDRPVVAMTVRRPNPDYPFPKPKAFPSLRDEWMDAQYLAERALATVMNTDYLGDALPSASPWLGPEVFSAFFGCELEFTETTSWAIPTLHDWREVDKIKFSESNLYWNKILEMTDVLLQVGKGKFHTGITDLHVGGDAIAAFRDPANLNFDMIEAAGQVKALLNYVTDVFFMIYDRYFTKISESGQAISAWPEIVSTKKWYVPSNDFSCMISKEMFDDVFLPGIIKECRFLEASIYHLDGPGALQHLDSLLDVKEINAIQWVYGAGHGRASDWMHVYERCQEAGKGLQLYLEIDELDLFMESLRPEGLWISLSDVRDREEGEAILKRLSAWR